MKKVLALFVVVFISCIVFADLQTPTVKSSLTSNHENSPSNHQNLSRDVPEWEFIIDPQNLISNYYDYMPGSYNSTPIVVQSDISYPSSFPANGKYIIFHGRETAASTRRMYYAYIDASGNVTNVATIGTDDIHEGYAGVDIDPVTCDPLVSWHVDSDPSSAGLECVLTYDLFHLSGTSGLWRAPFEIIDDNTPSANAPHDHFAWPYVFIGPSPDPDKRRVYVVANNVAVSPNGDPSENVLIAYADFNVIDLNAQSELDWSYRTIQVLDDWHNEIPEWIRPAQACAVSDDGKIALMGYTITADATSTMTDRIYVLYNDDYGEGDFEYFDADFHMSVDNPLNQDGTPRFADENGDPLDIYFAPYLCNHMNAIFADGGTKLHFIGNMNMMIYPNSWYPDFNLMYPKVYTYDIINNEFSFYELGVRGADPADDQVMVPWDLDADTFVDNFDPDGYVLWEDGWPIYHYAHDVAFHENYFKISKNEEKNWLVGIWSDGLKARYGNTGVPGYEDWAEYPEIVIAVSKDGGETWQDEIIINAKADDDNFAPELDGMIPEYLYIGDKIEDLGAGWGLVHLFFLDDNSYGSNIQSYGENTGGTQIYAAIMIHIDPEDGADPTVTSAPFNLYQNYPNPFNPTTTISFSLTTENTENTEIVIYNVKGQKVKTLVNERLQAGEHSVMWNGMDDNNRQVGSGVYFYKMKTGSLAYTKKMILLK